jgi:hypothetical protein
MGLLVEEEDVHGPSSPGCGAWTSGIFTTQGMHEAAGHAHGALGPAGGSVNSYQPMAWILLT